MSGSGVKKRPAAGRKAATLRASRARSPRRSVDTLAGETPEASFILDGEGRCAQVSSAAARILDRRRSDLPGRAFADLLAAESRPAWETTLARLRNGEDEVRQRLVLQQRNGREAHIEFVGRPERTLALPTGGLRLAGSARERAQRPADKQIVAVQGVVHLLDEADRPAAYAQHPPEEDLRPVDWQALFDSLRDPIYVVDRRGIIRQANPASEIPPAGYPRAQVLGQSFFKFFPPHWQAALKTVWKALLKNGRPGYLETEAVRHDGGLIPVGLSYSRLSKGGDEYVVVLHDISRRVALEDSLRKRHAELEAICAVTAALVGTLDPSALPSVAGQALDKNLRFALSRACDVLGADGGAVVLLDNDQLVCRAAQGWRNDPVTAGAAFAQRAREGLIGRVAASGKRLAWAASHEAGRRPLKGISDSHRLDADEFRDEDAHAVASLPLNGRERIVGVLSLFRRSPRPFTPDEMNVLSAMADPLGLAVENTRLYEGERARRQKLDVLAQVSQAFSTGLDLNAVLQVTLDQVMQITGASRGVVFTVNREMGCFEPRTWRGCHERAIQQLQSTPLKLTQGINGRAYHLQRIVMSDDTRRDADYVTFRIGRSVLSEMVIPLMCSGHVLGTIDLSSRHLAAFAGVEPSLLQAVADQLAVAIENAQLYEETLRHAEGLAALNAVAATISQSLDLKATLNVALDKALEVIGVEAGAISLVDEEAGEIVIRAHRGWRYEHLADRIRVKLGTGLSGQVVSTGEAITTGDVTNDPRLAVPEFEYEGVQAMVLAPMHARGKVVGVLSVMSYQPHTFTSHDVALLTAMADQVGVAIDNARLYGAESRRSAHLALINQVARQAISTLDLSDLLNRVAEEIHKSFGYFHVALYLLDPAGEQVVLRAQAGGHSDVLPLDYRQSVQEGMIGYTAREGETLLANDIAQEPRYIRFSAQQIPIAAELCVPILHGGQVIGVLDAQDLERGAFGLEDVRAMETLAVQLGIAIQNARLFEETRQRVAELTALQEISLQVGASLDIGTVLNTILQNALKLVRADDAHVFLYDADKEEFASVAALWKDGSRTPAVTKPRRDGLTARVLHSAEPIVINDAPTHPLYTAEAQAWGIQAIVGFPLRRADRKLGVLTIAYLTPHTFTSDELRVLDLLADQAVSAVDNARLYEETRRQLDELAALHEVSLAATFTLELAAVVERIVAALHRSLRFEHVGLFLVNEAEGTADLYAHSGTEGDFSRNLRIKLGHGIVGVAVVTGKPLRVGNVSADPHYVPGIPGVLSEMAVPLKAGERVIAAIDIQSSRPDAFDPDDERLLVTVGGQLAVTIENARLYELERQRRQQLENLQLTAASINAELELDSLLQLIAEKAARTFEAQASGLLMWSEDSSALTIQASYGLSSEYVENQRIPPESAETIRQVPVVVEDLSRSPFGDPLLIEREGLVSALAVPMLSSGQFKGLLVIYSKGQPRKFTVEEIEMGQIFASQAGIAIENARLYAVTRRRLDELSIMSEVALAGAGSLDLPQVLERMLDAIRRTLRFETFEFILQDPASGLLRTEAAYGMPPDTVMREMRLGEGIVGWVAEQRQPLLVPDVRQEPRYIAASPRTCSELAVPLTVGERVIGVMNVESLQVNCFTEDDRHLLSALAGQLAVIIENARLHREMRRRLDEVSTLYSLAQKMSTSLTMNVVLDSIVSSLKLVLNCRSVNIWLVSPDSQELEIYVAAGVADRWKHEARLKMGEGIAGRVASTAKPIYVPDTHSVDFIFFDPAVRSLLCVPMLVRDRVNGVLAIDKDMPNAFTPDDERLLTIAAAPAAVAIENARLYEDLKQHAKHLEQAYTELQTIDRLKDELVQNVSHELRTPLTFIKGYVELLLGGEMGQINEQQRETLAIVSEKTNTITRLVSDIIFLQQIEHESLLLADVDLVKVARRALQSNQVTATAAKIALQVVAPPDLPLARADRDRVNQVLDNLIGNAIKFSPQGGMITVRLEDAGDMIQVSVSDTGIGIPADQLERIFERFYQVDGSATRRFGGAGLGLAIVKRIVEAHGGRIWADSQVEHGSTFTFTLPKAKAPGDTW